jgi:hypothetical protein
MNRWFDAAIAIVIAALISIPTHAADSLAAARDLYAAAEYEDALALLNQLRPGDHAPDERRTIEQYRAYCLLALGRSVDAEQAIAAVVTATPLYKPSGADASPRVRSAFSDVRRRMLPSIIQEKYAAAKVAFDRKNFSIAATVFTEVVEAMSDPDVEDVVKQPPLADLRVLAIGFRDLSVSAAAPPPVLVRETPPTTAPALLVTPAPATVVASLRVYATSDAQVVPPTARAGCRHFRRSCSPIAVARYRDQRRGTGRERDDAGVGESAIRHPARERCKVAVNQRCSTAGQ